MFRSCLSVALHCFGSLRCLEDLISFQRCLELLTRSLHLSAIELLLSSFLLSARTNSSCCSMSVTGRLHSANVNATACCSPDASPFTAHAVAVVGVTPIEESVTDRFASFDSSCRTLHRRQQAVSTASGRAGVHVAAFAYAFAFFSSAFFDLRFDGSLSFSPDRFSRCWSSCARNDAARGVARKNNAPTWDAPSVRDHPTCASDEAAGERTSAKMRSLWSLSACIAWISAPIITYEYKTVDGGSLLATTHPLFLWPFFRASIMYA